MSKQFESWSQNDCVMNEGDNETVVKASVSGPEHCKGCCFLYYRKIFNNAKINARASIIIKGYRAEVMERWMEG